MARTLASKFVVLAWFVFASTVSALELSFERRAPRGMSLRSPWSGRRYSFSQTDKEGSASVDNVNDFRYVTNITINGVEVQVALDTGSTDLWVIPPGGIGAFNDTGIPLKLSYGDGSYGTSGTIGVAPFSFGSYNVPMQAFLDAQTSNVRGLQELDINGVMGLSFDLASVSPINRKIKELYGPDATWGRSVLRNIFAQDATQPNFIGINLARTGDLEDTTGGALTIGDYDERFVDVKDSERLPQHPTGGDRWTTLLGGIFVDGEEVQVTSTIAGVPAGQARALLDTGDPSSIFPTAVMDGIYSRIPGAALYDDPTTQTRVWVLPCNTTAHVEFVFGSKIYSIHPLDLSTISDPVEVDGQPHIACVSSFVGADGWGDGAFDISLGDTFLRNVYSVFDFGDTLPDGTAGEPYMQLLNKTDPAKANAQVASIRGTTLAALAPEMDPAALVAALLGPGSSPASPVHSYPAVTPTASPIPAASSSACVSPDATPLSDAPGANLAAGGTRISSSSEAGSGSADALLRRYAPVVIGLLAANLLLTTALIAAVVLGWVRRGTAGRKGRNGYGGTERKVIDPHSQYAPVKNPADYQQRDEREGYGGMYGQ